MLRTSASPTVIQGGQRYNVVPSEATATIDVRLLPDEDPNQILSTIRQLINDPAVEVRFAQRDGAPRPAGGTRIDTEAFRAIETAVKKHYQTTLLPTMSTGASDKAQVRSKGVHCYGVGPATTSRTGRKASVRIATRNEFSKASCNASQDLLGCRNRARSSEVDDNGGRRNMRHRVQSSSHLGSQVCRPDQHSRFHQ